MNVTNHARFIFYRTVWGVAMYTYLFIGDRYSEIAKWAITHIASLREDKNEN